MFGSNRLAGVSATLPPASRKLFVSWRWSVALLVDQKFPLDDRQGL